MAGFSFRGETRAMSLRLRRMIAASRAALTAERLTRAFWPFFTTLCLVAAVVLFGLFEVLPGLWHRLGLGVGVAAVVGSFALGVWRFRSPGDAEARARLDAEAPGRPLATLADRIAAGEADPWAKAVWLEHQRRAEAAANALRARAPDLRLSRYDHLALRLVAPVLLIAGVMAADGRYEERLASLLSPPIPEGAGAVATYERRPMAEGWATPPAHTGLDTVYFSTEGSAIGHYTLPEGSLLTIRVTDLAGPPEVEMTVGLSSDTFATPVTGLSELNASVEGSGQIVIRSEGEVLADWTLDVTPDETPEITMPETPVMAISGAVEIFFTARDDYGVTSAWAEITPPGGMAEPKGIPLEPITFALPLPITGDPRDVSDSVMQEFGEHPWAGGEVELTLYAEDGAGQIGTHGPVRMMLPGRNFRHPLARALVEQRRELALDFGEAERVLDVLQAVTSRPEEVFGDKHGAYLGTRMAIQRLAYAIPEERVPDEAPDIIEFLWQAALTLDGGDLADAMERLRQAEQRLRDALENGTDEEVAAAIDELRDAIQQYLEEMVRQALENGMDPSQQQQQQQGSQGNELTQQDLNEMLDELQRRAEGGLRDQARDMLSQLSRMLENLQAGRQQQGQQGGQGQQAMQELQELIQRQRDLADRTFGEARREQREGGQQGQNSGQQSQQGEQQGQQGEGQLGQGQGQGQQGQGQSPGQGQRQMGQGEGGLSAQQEELRRMLDELTRQMPGGQGTEEMRRALEDAERAMGQARDDLEGGQPGEAIDDQMEALDRLNEGANALAEAMRQQGQGDVNAQGNRRGRGEMGEDDQADPFDRPSGSYGSVDGRDTGVPDRSAMDRAREVLEELRRRAGEPMRPQLELDYLERLIDQF